MKYRLAFTVLLLATTSLRAEHQNSGSDGSGGQNGNNQNQNQGQFQGDGMAMGGAGGGAGATYKPHSDPDAIVKFGQQESKAFQDMDKSIVSFAKDSSSSFQKALESTKVEEAGTDFIKSSYDALNNHPQEDFSKDTDGIIKQTQETSATEVQAILALKNATVAPPTPKAAAAPVPTVGDMISGFGGAGSSNGRGLAAGSTAGLSLAGNAHPLSTIPSRNVASHAAETRGAPQKSFMEQTLPAYNQPEISVSRKNPK